jgi:hypothetical protein
LERSLAEGGKDQLLLRDRSVADEDVEPGFCTVSLSRDIMKMRVKTYDVAGKPAQRPSTWLSFAIDCLFQSCCSTTLAEGEGDFCLWE